MGQANHPPVAKLAHSNRLNAKPGDRVELSAAGSKDPDGHALSYKWFCYNDAGSYATSGARDGRSIPIQDYDQSLASFTVPTRRVMQPGTGDLHIILSVTDHGTPRLTRYQRVIVTVSK